MRNALSTILNILIISNLAVIALYAAPGDLDLAFDFDGIVTTDISNYANNAWSMAIQPDGKIVVVGISYAHQLPPFITVVRYLADGSYDNSFDGDGIVITPFPSFSLSANDPTSVAIQPDGKIVVAATTGEVSTSYDFTVIRYNTDGSLDPTFDGDGKVSTHIGTSQGADDDHAASVVIQSDGKLVVAGTSGDAFTSEFFTVVRYNSDGSLDSTFDGDGKVSFLTDGGAYAMAIQPLDGKIIVGGFSFNGVSGSGVDFAVVRFNANGSLDTTFDGDGIVTTSFSTFGDIVSALEIQTDGKIVATGSVYVGSTPGLGLVRYNMDGSFDTTFDGDGIVTTPLVSPGQCSCFYSALQSNGKILVTGGDGDFRVIRYNTDGALDTSFDGDGMVTTSLGTQADIPTSVAIQTDGKIVVAGWTNYSLTFAAYDFAVIRYMGDSTPPPTPTPTPIPTPTPTPTNIDSSFGGNGRVTTPITPGARDDIANAVAVQTDGKVVAAGSSHNGSNNDFAVARYNADGSPDLSFDIDGKTVTPIGVSTDLGQSVAIQADGKIVVAGSSFLSPTVNFAIVRYNPDGSLDLTFDSDGKVTTDFAGNRDIAYSVAIQTDGKIMVAGISGVFPNHDFAAARYNADGSLDTTFDTDGRVTTPIGTANDEARAVKLQKDGQIVLAGFSSNGANTDFAAVRYNADGSLDGSFDGDGKVTTPIGSANDQASSASIQTDGKIVLGGDSFNGLHNYFALVRYNDDGSLDSTFDFDGKSTTPVGFLATLAAIAIQPGGRIVSAGFSKNAYTNDITVIRNNADGSLDRSWGTGGIATTDIANFDDNVTALAIQTDGKPVVAGSTYDNATNLDFFLARYPVDAGTAVGNPGVLDPDFRLDGTVEAQGPGQIQSIRLQPDGKIVAVGNSFQVLRFLQNGSRDTSFDSDGIMFAATGLSQSVAIQADGKIVVAGSINLGGGGEFDFAVVRINPNGSLDTTFDTDGTVITPVGMGQDVAYAVAIQADGKIVVAGRSDATNSSYAVVRYNTDGSLDTTFDGDGKVMTPLVGNAISDSLVLQPDGKIVVAHGIQDMPPNFRSVLGILRYNTDGSLDTTLDGDGVVLTPLGQSIERPSVTLQFDGKIVAVCSSSNGDSDFAVVRYNSNGSLDNSFSSDGKTITSIAGGISHDRANAVAITQMGQIVVGGSNINSGNTNLVTLRYTASGLPDSSWGPNGIVLTDLGGNSETFNAILIQPDGKVLAGGESDLASPGSRQFILARYFGDGFAPTAASVSVGGRVSAPNGRAISRVRVTITDAASGEVQTALTSSFGYFRFEGILAGQSYILEAAHKRINLHRGF